MFFSHFVLAKKGPLARIWLAAHWDKKLTKAHIFEINIERSVEGILQPKIKMALRTSGHLLLGVVRIYSRKAKYLLADCNEAFIKIKMAFRPGVVDLPEGNREAALASITLPEVFHDFENIADITIDLNPPTTLNQSRAEDITLKEDYGTLSLMNDDTFGDMAFDDPEMVRDATNIDEGFDTSGLLISPEKDHQMENGAMAGEEPCQDQGELQETDDITLQEGLDDNMNKDGPDGPDGAGIFEASGLFEDAPMMQLPMSDSTLKDNSQQVVPTTTTVNDIQRNADNDSDDDIYDDMGPASVGLPSGPSSPDSVIDQPSSSHLNTASAVPVPLQPPMPGPSHQEMLMPMVPQPYPEPPLMQNDPESFALAPLDATVYRGVERTKSKRKRKLIVDEVKNISGEEMKCQLSDCRDIITTLDLAPPTKRLMHWKESGGVEKLFALPGHPLHSKVLGEYYMRHLTTRSVENEPSDFEEPQPTLEYEQQQQQQLQQREEGEHSREITRHSKRQRVSGPDLSFDIPPIVPEQPEEEPQLPQIPATQEPAVSVVSQDSCAEVTKELLPEMPQPVLDATSTEQEPLLPPQATPSDLESAPLDISVADATREQNALSDSIFDKLCSQQQAEGHPSNTQQEPEVQQDVTQVPHGEKTANEQNALAADDDDDYNAPDSVGPPEEQLADESYEQFEERIHSRRAAHLLGMMKQNLDTGNRIPFSAITRGNKRKQAAQKFYTCLVLKKQQAVELEQDAPYGEVYISKGDLFDRIVQ